MLWIGFLAGGAGLLLLIVLTFKNAISPKKLHVIEQLIENGSVKTAMRQAKMLLSRNDRNVDAHWFLGEAYRAENRAELAIVEYRYIANAMRFTSTATERKVRERLGECYLKVGQIDEAQKEFILLSRLDPDDPDVLYKIAELFEKRDYTDSAMANYKKVTELNPRHARAHFRLGVIYVKKNNFGEAKQELAQVLKLDPDNSAPHYYLGKIQRLKGDRTRALAHFEKALHCSDLRQRVYLERANIFVMEKEYQEAISELLKAVEIGDSDMPAALAVRYLLSRCYEAVNDLGKAIDQWEWITERNPKYADVPVKLSMYGGLRADDQLKDFLIAPRDKFAQYSERIVNLLGLKMHKEITGENDVYEFTAFDGDRKVRRMGSGICLVRIIRSTEPVGYEPVRGLYEEMRRMKASRSVFVTASKFTNNAVEFAHSRPIDLLEKEELTKLLKKISL
jgi:tetratricopeptide (TPR) repeat protein